MEELPLLGVGVPGVGVRLADGVPGVLLTVVVAVTVETETAPEDGRALEDWAKATLATAAGRRKRANRILV